MVRDLGGCGAHGLKGTADSHGYLREALVGGEGGVVETFVLDEEFLVEKSLAEVGDLTVKFGELGVAAADISAELGAAEPVALDSVVDGSIRQFGHTEKVKA